MTNVPEITVAVPSMNQGCYLDAALNSIFSQGVNVEVFVVDGGSIDESLEIIKKWSKSLSGWRSKKDNGQASAINEAIASGSAPYVCWLNSDDLFLSGGLKTMLNQAKNFNKASVVYGRTYDYNMRQSKFKATWVEDFNAQRLSLRCIISQPGTLIKRSIWNEVGGLDNHLKFAMDYDLWWKIYSEKGLFKFCDNYVAVNRVHSNTKTRCFRKEHYVESIKVLQKYNKKVPLKWYLYQPYAVWYRSLVNKFSL